MKIKSNIFKDMYVKPIGYYKNQHMVEECKYPDVAKELGEKFKIFSNNFNNENTYIFSTSYGFLIGYYKGLIRVSNVQWNDSFGTSIEEQEWTKL